MKLHISLLALFFLSFGKTFAQPQPCGANADMTPTCVEACVICDIDGFTGINDSTIPGEAPDDFCTTTVHHAQWIAFIAGSEDLTIELEVFNCDNAGQFINGLEVGIYESLDCENFNLVSNCDGDVNDGTTGIFTTNQPLTIGQYYYWVMDGNNGDICNYTINVTEGTTEVPPLPAAGNITGNTAPCIGDTSTYSLPPITGANFYEWTVDGAVNTTTNSNFDIEWMTPGLHEICVTAFNVCDTVSPVCLEVLVPLPSSFVFTQAICEGDCFEVGDSMLCDPGIFEIILENWQGCDSTVVVTIEELPSITSNFTVNICEDDSIEVAGIVFYPPGSYQATSVSYLGCDSVINLTLNAIVCEMDGAIGATSVFCHGDQTGSIVFSVTDGTAPFTYTWQQLDGTPSGNGNLLAANMDETITDLPPGLYLIAIYDNFGNDVVLNVNVYEPPPLVLDFSVSDFNGTNVSCAGNSDGTISVSPSGGTPDYTFDWSNGGQGTSLTDLPAGIYKVTMTDEAGCTLVAEATLSEPPPLAFDFVFENPNCDGLETGSATVSGASGGTAPYLFQITGGSFGAEQTFVGLGGGTFDLTMQDANGCETVQGFSLQAPSIPIVEAGDDVTINLAESASLDVFSSLFPQTIIWSPTAALSCVDCLQPSANPFETTTYAITVISADDCAATDSVTVNVLKIRDIYAPNAFSPNGDGINDSFTLFGGAAVSEILELKVFSRWGELVFDGRNLVPNDMSTGWDGTFKEEAMQGAAFAWFAKVSFIDGEVIFLEGDVTLVR